MKGLNVLVVEQIDSTRDALKRILESMSFRAYGVSSGNEVINALLSPPNGMAFDLVILDWKIPGLDSYLKVVRSIKSMSKISTVPIVFLITEHEREQGLKLAEEMKVEQVITKPFTPSKVKHSITNLFDDGSSSNLRAKDAYRIETEKLKSLHGTKVLVAEDNLINQSLVYDLLTKVGIQVTLVENGVECLNCLEKEVFDAVLMDIQMPEMDGYETTERIRQSGQWSDIPIIAMTANATTVDKERCLNVGMVDHIPKPLEPATYFLLCLNG